MKKSVFVLLILISSLSAFGQSSIDSCKCFRCVKAREARKHRPKNPAPPKPTPPPTPVVAAPQPEPQIRVGGDHNAPVIITGTVRGDVTIHQYRDTVFMEVQAESGTKCAGQPQKTRKLIVRTEPYLEMLRRSEGHPLAKERFLSQDFGTENSRGRRWKRLRKKVSSVPLAGQESEYLLQTCLSCYSKDHANVFNTTGGAILVTWNGDEEDDPEGQWVADFKPRSSAVDDRSNDIRIFWRKK